MSGLSRRQLLFHAVPIGLAGLAFARPARAAGSCVQPDSESLRASLNYVTTAADASAACAHCAYFAADLTAAKSEGRIGNVSNAAVTYMLDGRQHILVAAGDTLYAFAIYE